MTPTWMFLPILQIGLAAIALGLLFFSYRYFEWLSNPIFAYSLLLWLGVAQAANRANIRSSPSWQKLGWRFTLGEVFAIALFVAVALAFGEVAARHDNWLAQILAFALPTIFAVWIHWKRQLSPMVGATIFFVSLFVFLAIARERYRHFFNQLHKDSPERLLGPVWELEFVYHILNTVVLGSTVYLAVSFVVPLTISQFRRNQCSEFGEPSVATKSPK